MQYKGTSKSNKYEPEKNPNNGIKLKKRIALKIRKMEKAKNFCNECQMEFDELNMFFIHIRSKHKQIVEVSS